MAYYAIKVKELEEDGRCYVAKIEKDGHLKMTGDTGCALVGWDDEQMMSMINSIADKRKTAGLSKLNMEYVCVNPS